ALEAAGIDTAHMGYQRLRTLILLHQGKQSLSARDELYSQTDLEMLNKNLFVSSATSKQIHFKPDFYRIAAVLADFFSIEDILKVFDLGSISFTGSVLLRIRYKILKAEPVSLGQAKMDRNSIEYLSFLGRYIDALGKMTDARFEQIKDCVSNSSPAQKRNLCLHLQKIPGGEYGMSIKTRAQKCGISTTTYYRALNNPDYGQFSLKKEKQDLQDKEAIESVLAYKSVPKGYRQVTMQLTRLGYPPMNHKKVYRLMKKYKLLSEVRKKSPAKIQLRESLKLRTQPNRLKRKFRLYKPLQVFLTDVSYLDYSDGQRAYLSAIKDPVSGKIITALVSSSQDLELGKQTLDGLVPYGSCMLHSDQGALYLNEEFQNKAASMNVILSMSRRGNCWDNASQESFFGHFKDECNYSDCSSLEELQQQISGYVNYYNFERPQASRNKMTPAEYESYLLSLNDQDWEKWLE
ncbi:MAG: IS3 family transposase, partial [Ileibacterium sp.]|nr:IS3 family transposase [Ileibacterium sp.]